ncbi:MAG: cytochrome c553 [Halioglobus sp.]
MTKTNLSIIVFFCFAMGLPLWAMQNNKFEKDSVHSCSGDCYERWETDTGGILAVAAAQAEARATASPTELGKSVYAGCIACHGAAGEGGVGPALSGQSAVDLASMLTQYKNGETRGNQSALMWSQAGMLSDDDVSNVSAYIETL